MFLKTGSVETVRAALGHSSIDVTLGYIKVDVENKEEIERQKQFQGFHYELKLSSAVEPAGNLLEEAIGMSKRFTKALAKAQARTPAKAPAKARPAPKKQIVSEEEDSYDDENDSGGDDFSDDSQEEDDTSGDDEVDMEEPPRKKAPGKPVRLVSKRE